MKIIGVVIVCLLSVEIVTAFDFGEYARQAGVPVMEVEVLGDCPHDSSSFTQGLLFHDGALYESTGIYGQSSVRELDATTGEVLRKTELPHNFFGEGLALWRNDLIQLTWQEHTAIVYGLDDLQKKKIFAYETEGWGLTSDAKQLFHSDGSDKISCRLPSDFSVIKTLSVTLGGRPISSLNELEYANGLLYANVLGLDYILEIDPASGVVTAVCDLTPLRAWAGASTDVRPLNGIAAAPQSGDFFVTGKLWPAVFRVRFVQGFGK